MADNTQLNARETEGDTIATDDIGGIKHQRVKVQYGPDGSATDVSLVSPLPVYSLSIEEIQTEMLLELRRLNDYMALMTNNDDPPEVTNDTNYLSK